MNIGEKIKTAEDLFRNHYFAHESESIRLGSGVLEAHGLGENVLREFICPALIKKGVLKNYSFGSVGRRHIPEDYAQPERARELDGAIHHANMKLSGIIDPDSFAANNPIVWGIPFASEHLPTQDLVEEAQLREINRKELEDLIAERNSLERLFSFEVNADYFKRTTGQMKGQEAKDLNAHEEGASSAGEDLRPGVVIDLQKGIYDASHPDRIYEISGKRKKLVEHLSANPVASLSDLTEAIGQQDSLMVKEISEINKNFKNLLVVKGDLIVNSKTAGGYSLNKREFTIKSPETSV